MSREPPARRATPSDAGPDATDGPIPRGATLTDHRDGSPAEARRQADLELLEQLRGQTLGRYVLIAPIGRGGMGVVYAAYDPELDRRVALKLLRRDDETGRARLMREAQAMARVVHPNVITVHDVGRFEGGVFVAMELVDGVDLGRWQSTRSRTWREILGVYLQAGRGLAAAHRAGLVHRDFKPTNVLVGSGDVVKVLDFGLARLDPSIDPSVDSAELRALSGPISGDDASVDPGGALTRTGALMGTPAYMAPEQHARRELDARTDQFSYCVALYEALHDQRPFEGRSRIALAVQTNRGEVRAPPRGTAVPARITRAVMRGLSPDPDDRFASMTALLAELSHDPGRPRRRALAVAAAGLLLAVGVYGYVRDPARERQAPTCPEPSAALASTWGDPQRQALQQRFERSALPYADDAARFVIDRLDGWVEQWVAARRRACEATRIDGTQTDAILALRNQCLDRQRKDLAARTQLLTEGPVDRDTMGRADRLVTSLPDPAACDDTEALGRVPPPADVDTRLAVETLHGHASEARALLGAGRYDDALQRVRTLRTGAEQTGYLPLLAEVLELQGEIENHEGDHAAATETLHRAARVAVEARHDELLAETWLELAWNAAMGRSQYDEALQWTDYAEATIRRLGQPRSLRTNVACVRGNILWAKGDLEAALDRLSTCLALREEADPQQPLVANTLSYLGNVYIDLGRYEDAEAAFRRGLALAQQIHGVNHPLTASMHNGLGVVLYYRHHLAEAEAQYQRAYEINVRVLGEEHPDLLYSLGNIANCRRERGEYEAALASMERVEALVQRAFPAEHREVGTTAHNIAELLALLGRHEQAQQRYAQALEVREKVHGPQARYVANSLTGKAESLLEQSRDGEALGLLERALEIRGVEPAAQGPASHDKERGRTRFALARALVRTGGDRERARQLALGAREDFAPIDSALDRQRYESVVAWLEETAPEAAGLSAGPSAGLSAGPSAAPSGAPAPP